MSHAISLKSVSQRIPSRILLDSIDWVIGAGECVGMVGVNGAGKTTLIKSILNLTEISAGEIEIFGISHRQSHARQSLCFLPERFNPPYYLTGQAFLRYMAKLWRCDYQQNLIETICSQLDFELNALTQPSHTLSKGMAQKLGLIACLMSQKDLYLLDEPMSGLDPKARALFKYQLLQLKAQGKTVFFTSHSLADVEEMAEKMAVLEQGKLAYVGQPSGLIARHETVSLEQAFLRCIERPVSTCI